MSHPRSKLTLYLISVLMGFCGLAIPGLSASTIAIIFLVYYDMIYAISHIFSKPKQSIIFLLILVAGYATGAVAGTIAVNTVYQNFPIPMVGAVLGFLAGTIPRMTVETRKDFKKPFNWVVMIVVAGIFLLYTMLVGGDQDLVFEEIRLPADYIIMLVVGMVTSTTLVIPGVDFAITLMAMGYYFALIDLMGNVVELFTNPARLFLLLAYVVGYGIGSFFLSKGLRYLTKRFPRQVHCVNYAMVCVAPLIVIKKCIVDNPNFMAHFTGAQMVWAIVLAAAGFFAYTWVPVVLRYVGILPKDVQEEGTKRAAAARADDPCPEEKRETVDASNVEETTDGSAAPTAEEATAKASAQNE